MLTVIIINAVGNYTSHENGEVISPKTCNEVSSLKNTRITTETDNVIESTETEQNSRVF